MEGNDRLDGTVYISDQVYNVCLSHAMMTEREEVMGLLLGDASYRDVRIWTSMTLVRNDKRPDRVEIAPEQLVQAVDAGEKLTGRVGRTTRVVGWYHSHPHITCLPSHVDLQTQLMYQGMDADFIGLIFGCFNAGREGEGSALHELIAFRSRDKGLGNLVQRNLAVKVVPLCRLLTQEQEDGAVGCVEYGGSVGQHSICSAVGVLLSEVERAEAEENEGAPRNPHNCSKNCTPEAALVRTQSVIEFLQSYAQLATEHVEPLIPHFDDVEANLEVQREIWQEHCDLEMAKRLHRKEEQRQEAKWQARQEEIELQLQLQREHQRREQQQGTQQLREQQQREQQLREQQQREQQQREQQQREQQQREQQQREQQQREHQQREQQELEKQQRELQQQEQRQRERQENQQQLQATEQRTNKQQSKQQQPHLSEQDLEQSPQQTKHRLQGKSNTPMESRQQSREEAEEPQPRNKKSRTLKTTPVLVEEEGPGEEAVAAGSSQSSSSFLTSILAGSQPSESRGSEALNPPAPVLDEGPENLSIDELCDMALGPLTPPRRKGEMQDVCEDFCDTYDAKAEAIANAKAKAKTQVKARGRPKGRPEPKVAPNSKQKAAPEIAVVDVVEASEDEDAEVIPEPPPTRVRPPLDLFGNLEQCMLRTHNPLTGEHNRCKNLAEQGSLVCLKHKKINNFMHFLETVDTDVGRITVNAPAGIFTFEGKDQSSLDRVDRHLDTLPAGTLPVRTFSMKQFGTKALKLGIDYLCGESFDKLMLDPGDDS
eukprot:gb/GFBE01070761.1/.p1 GENE.gb/GFBE01070761.1/~~gb/GFBE01070761.1/.p1  ORF type:complete len:770 (+),score=160.10 gb/GFBE01070761.1/:1-2310(+)